MGVINPAGLGKSMNQLKPIVNPFKAKSKITTAFNNLDSPSTAAEIASWSNGMKASALDEALFLAKLGNRKPLYAVLEVTENADLSSIVRKYGRDKDFDAVFKVLPHGDAKTLDSAFKLYPSVVDDPRYLEVLFKAVNREMPGGDMVTLRNFKTILSEYSKSKANPGGLLHTMKIFMQNMDYMNGPNVKSYLSKKYPKTDPRIDILTILRNDKGLVRIPQVVHEIDRYYYSYSYIINGFHGDTQEFMIRGLLRMDSSKLNNEILKAATKKKDVEILKYLKTLDAEKFGLDWNYAL